MQVRSGVTRHCLLVGRWAVKVPRARERRFWIPPARGWLANRSEWRQRRREGVARPVLTLGHLALVFRRADEVGSWEPDDAPEFARTYEPDDDTGEPRLVYEVAKGSSWGRFGDRWLLIDFDRSWEHPRGLVGGLYFGRRERLARRWMRQAETTI